jgi:hypothetical protein
MMKIKLTHGKFALVSDRDYGLVKKYRWRLKKSRNTFYARAKEAGKTIYLHRLIKGVTRSDLIVDHKNLNGLDNTRRNLRVCQVHQNSCNRGPVKKRSINGSKYKGVHWSKPQSRWIASIMKNYKKIYLGSFLKERDAAQAYDKKARVIFGTYAYLNIS